MQAFETPMDKTPFMAPTPAMDYVKENVAPYSAQQDSHLTHVSQSVPEEGSSSKQPFCFIMLGYCRPLKHSS